MYQSVLFALLGLMAIAIGGAVFGWVSHEPLAIVGGGSVAVGVALVVNAACAYVAGTRPHQISAIITGLLIAFLFTPPATLSGYIVIALVSAIAMLSKYVLVWRKRHVFNPVAIAATISLLTGLGAASWWVATPLLTMPMILFGTLVLYRTNRLDMGYVYIAVGFAVTIVVSLLQGSSPTPASLLAVVTSYPVLFLVYFMLSEPLTQPPRRVQRNILAAAIAMLAGAQLTVGAVFITPEIALVLANLAAFLLFSRRGRLVLRFVGSRELAQNGQVEYRFVPQRPLRFEAGQYLEMTLFHRRPDQRGVRRMFTIASSPEQKELRIVVRHSQRSSSFKRALAALQKNDEVSATGVYGDFVLPADATKKLLFVAGGIGITPFLSHIQSLRAAGEKRDAVLLYFISQAADAAYVEELRAAQQLGVRLEIVTEFASSDIFKKYVDDIRERHAYVSGPPLMVDAVVPLLRELSIRSVYRDQFDGY